MILYNCSGFGTDVAQQSTATDRQLFEPVCYIKKVRHAEKNRYDMCVKGTSFELMYKHLHTLSLYTACI